MALYGPTPQFTDHDKRLLALMAKLLIEQTDGVRQGANALPGMVVLSDAEAKELATNLEKLAQSPEFMRASYFAEGVTRQGDEERVREIYLAARTKSGKSRAMAGSLWADFKIRLGINRPSFGTKPTRTMTLPYFHQMERKLLRASGLSPQVVDLLTDFVQRQDSLINEVREQKRELQHGIVRAAVVDPLIRWAKDHKPLADRHIPRDKIAAAMTVVADTTVMFTTRDWGVAGTLSTVAGALACVAAD